jgi:flagellar hook-associated protein 1 FlgK
MSLSSAFQIGRSALAASQLGIQVTGNNVANAATPGYSRQVLSLGPTQEGRFGNSLVGRGVDVLGVRRQTDNALQSRLWSSISSESRDSSDLSLLATVETSLRALDANNSLPARLNSFFSSWSNLADQPSVAGNRSLVVQSGRQAAAYMRDLRTSLTSQRDQIDQTLASNVNRANDLLGQVAALNTQIVVTEGGQGNAGSLRDQRDAIVTELAKFLDVTPIEQSNGNLDLLVGSTPIVLAGQSRGIELRIRTINGATEAAVVAKDNKEVIPITGGQVGSLLTQRTELVSDTITRLDEVATALIARVNRLHSQSSPSTPQNSFTGTRSIRTTDQGLAMNDPLNQSFANLPAPLRPTSGSFIVTLRNTATGASQSTTINVDLDGITSTFTPGTANDTTVTSLTASINAVGNLSATVNASGQLQLTADTGYDITLSDDTSGVLANLGVNTFFTGSTAEDIAVRADLSQDPNLLATGRTTGGNPSANGGALAIAQLKTTAISELGGVTFNDSWDQAVQSIAVRTSAARTNAGAAKVVRENLDAQRSSLSGVSLDEEAINLLNSQRHYQASARFITVVDELTQTLLSLVR